MEDEGLSQSYLTKKGTKSHQPVLVNDWLTPKHCKKQELIAKLSFQKRQYRGSYLSQPVIGRLAQICDLSYRRSLPSHYPKEATRPRTTVFR